MQDPTRQVVVLGSTGSVGENALEVIAASSGRLAVFALSAHTRLELLVKQAQELQPRFVVATNTELARQFDWSGLPDSCQLLVGENGVGDVVRSQAVDTVLVAIVGSAGLMGTWSALEAGKRVALANKESLVMAGGPVTQLATRTGGSIVPVDSEHSAIFQALEGQRRSALRRIVLTASGGPLREWTVDEMKDVRVEDALAHPTWKMGPKITVDSATMMNKALEIIEARWLFDVPEERIEVVIHPQSLVHSMVEFADGSLLAQLGPPDMKLPIQYALSYPERWDGPADRIDLAETWQLDFSPPDPERFPALELGREVARVGGSAGAVLNAANESVVAEFLDGRLRFNDIVPACRAVLEQHEFESEPSVERLVELDRWAREEIKKWNCR